MQRDVVINLRIAASVVILFAAVSVARYVVGFPTRAALAVGDLVGYIVSVMTVRYVLPQIEIMGDREPIEGKKGVLDELGGGEIISETCVLTAAHCMFNP
jgi:hypothetical protein